MQRHSLWAGHVSTPAVWLRIRGAAHAMLRCSACTAFIIFCLVERNSSQSDQTGNNSFYKTDMMLHLLLLAPLSLYWSCNWFVCLRSGSLARDSSGNTPVPTYPGFAEQKSRPYLFEAGATDCKSISKLGQAYIKPNAVYIQANPAQSRAKGNPKRPQA